MNLPVVLGLCPMYMVDLHHAAVTYYQKKKSKGGEVLENVSKNGNTENIMKESNHIRDNKVSKASAPFGQSSAKAKSKKLQKKKSLKRL
mmetsp:Transcript_15891/g.16081  ORF Transcript_15891/g.16081 Transcript_15891/m.16081 type:complete len:89 (+) Transcript_15891:439-705(+)